MRTEIKPNEPLTAEGRELRLKARPSARFNSLRSSKNREIHPHECALRHIAQASRFPVEELNPAK